MVVVFGLQCTEGINGFGCPWRSSKNVMALVELDRLCTFHLSQLKWQLSGRIAEIFARDWPMSVNRYLGESIDRSRTVENRGRGVPIGTAKRGGRLSQRVSREGETACSMFTCPCFPCRFL